MKQSPARIALVLLFVFIGCFGTAYAAAGMLTALPAPMVGGTCGPSTGSETATEALLEPGSIGAGPEPPASNVTAHSQWKTFIQQCQSLADRRGLASLAIFVISVAVASIGLILVFRRPRTDKDDDELVDGASEWQPGTDESAQLVGVGAVAAAPMGAWGDPAAPVPYPAQAPGWPAAPAGPPPYPYGTAPGYPAPAGYQPAAAYPSAPAAYPGYGPPPSAPPGYAPPPYPAYPAQSPPATPPPTSAIPVGPATIDTSPVADDGAHDEPGDAGPADPG